MNVGLLQFSCAHSSLQMKVFGTSPDQDLCNVQYVDLNRREFNI